MINAKTDAISGCHGNLKEVPKLVSGGRESMLEKTFKWNPEAVKVVSEQVGLAFQEKKTNHIGSGSKRHIWAAIQCA